MSIEILENQRSNTAQTHVRQVRAMTAHGMFRSIEDLKCMGTLEDLQITLLERRPELLHLSTHSSSGSLVFDSPLVKYRAALSAATTERLTDVVDRQLLIDTICIHAQTNLRCVFLNSCHTYELAISLRKGGVETIICWRTKVADGAARDFADAFYRALSSVSPARGPSLSVCVPSTQLARRTPSEALHNRKNR